MGKIFIVSICHSTICYSRREKDIPDSPKLEYSHYDVQLKIIPNEQYIEVAGKLRFLVMDDSLDELSFNLHNKMELK